jgi:hypothetical protein
LVSGEEPSGQVVIGGGGGGEDGGSWDGCDTMVLLLLFSSDEDGCLGLDGVRLQLPLKSGAEPLGHTVVWHLPLKSGAEPLGHGLWLSFDIESPLFLWRFPTPEDVVACLDVILILLAANTMENATAITKSIVITYSHLKALILLSFRS